MYSILQLKAKEGIPQTIAFELEPSSSWLETTPHQFYGNVNVVGTIKLENGAVSLVADLQVPIKYVCDRCGESFVKNLNATLSANYEEVGEYETPSDIELEYKIVSNRIDLEPIVRDTIIENLPTKVLCKDDCKGLCPTCGKNLNGGECKCNN